MNHIIEDDTLGNEDIDIEYDVFINESIVEDNVEELKDLNILEELAHTHLKIETNFQGLLSVEPFFAEPNLSLDVVHQDPFEGHSYPNHVSSTLVTLIIIKFPMISEVPK